ncbi:unnamed protein product [Cuscuta epithymum]|uniref:CCHC-type domain-containing protein n=1 Tax=Cuscuta epithymum TaxID=186058 RepID=A0AAV0ESU0_9ASTE|nr:unnamed protein product [Cuscuta epithymum]
MNTVDRLEEGYSTVRPPMFNGQFYQFWKSRMENFIKADNYQVWNVIEGGDNVITKLNGEGKIVPKPKAEFTTNDYQKLEHNAQALKYLICGLGPAEHNRVLGCKTAKQMWDLLEVTHEGTSRVKKSKIDIFMRNYELFVMKPGESIKDMITRFTNIINELSALGREITVEDQVRKILRSLPQVWKPKTTAIEEAKDLSTMTLEDLTGSLLTYELGLQEEQDAENARRERGIALKAREEEEESESESEDEMSIFARQFGKMYRRFKNNRNKQGKNNFQSFNNQGCFVCGSLEHRAKDCSQKKNDRTYDKNKSSSNQRSSKDKGFKRDLKRAMMAAWGDSSDDEEEESDKNSNHTGLCLMAHSDEESDQESFEVNFENFLSKFDSLSKTKARKIFKRLTIELNQNLSENDHLKSQITELESKLEEATRAKIRLKTKVGELIDERLKYSEVVLQQDQIICSLKLDSMNKQVNHDEKLLSKIPSVGTLIDHLHRLVAECTDFKNRPEYKAYSATNKTRSRPYSGTGPPRHNKKENETAGLGYIPRNTQPNKKPDFSEPIL